MSLNNTPSGERIHIGFFGRRNAGKSSLVNAVTGQELSVVSDVKGTTTDPVYKAMELLPLGAVEIIDTPGYDDEGMLGELRVKKTRQILAKTDIAVLVVDISAGMGDCEKELVQLFKDREIPCIIAYNKGDLSDREINSDNEITVSARDKKNIHELKEKIASLAEKMGNERRIIGDLLNAGDMIVLVTPIDESAPKGRMILPQVQTIRDILDANAMVIVSRETELAQTLKNLAVPPKIVVTDSQVFGKVNEIVSENIPLTSFSILMARYKGFLDTAVKGAAAIDSLKDGDKILISEGCTHHRQCGDIGSVKLPNMLKKYTGKNFEIVLTSGRDFPDDLTEYSLVIHCGGCMLNEKEVAYRRKLAEMQGVPFTNYGTALAKFSGILERSIAPIKNYE